MFPPPCFTVFLVNLTWNSLPFGRRTCRSASLPNKQIFVSSLQRMLRHFFSPSGPDQVLWASAKFFLFCKFAFRSSGTLRAILLGKFELTNRRRTVRDVTSLSISFAIAFDDLKGSRLANATIWWSVDGVVFLGIPRVSTLLFDFKAFCTKHRERPIDLAMNPCDCPCFRS